ncbi:MAG TPA: PEP-CTERM sorting domain-containing protein [Bryobacteraceae bacterium]|jgi:hypothetical protein|nr:PEP-CTERM sorting domain-containing protein [Bryobacteraceae bacterium]
MNKFLMLLAVSTLTLCVASASQIPCTIAGTTFGDPVNGTTVVTCGTLTFDNFEVVNPTNGAEGQVDVLGTSYFDTGSGQAYVEFNPNLLSAQDEEFLFSVWGGTSEIDMTVGGQNAQIQETACSAPVPTSGLGAGECPTGTLLGQITVGSNQAAGFANFNTTSPVYIFKNIETGAGGQLSEFTQSFGTIPEPVSMVLLGSGLLALGLLRRKSRKS